MATKHLRVPDSLRPDIGLLPDFMLIGPQRTGSTWLYMRLREHPEVFMSSPKEPLFFCYVPEQMPDPDESSGAVRTLESYIDLFRSPDAREARVTGEASAHYAVPLYWFPEVIDDIMALKPTLKCIGVIRDPVERAWSHAKLDLCKRPGRSVSDVTFDEWRAFLSSRYMRDCARYEEVYGCWLQRLAPGNFLCQRFKDLQHAPEDFLRQTCDFLGIDPLPAALQPGLSKAQNATDPVAPPPDVAALLQELYADDRLRLSAAGWV